MSALAWRRLTCSGLGPLLAALLPLLTGLGYTLAGPRPASAPAVRQWPPLAFHQHLVNLGRVEPRRDHFARFSFTNLSRQIIELRKLETSCGCLTQHTESKVIAPGADGEFFLRIQSANQTPGPKQYTCKAIYGPVGEPDVSYATDLVFVIELPKLSVGVKPQALVFHQPNGQTTTHSVLITDLRPEALRVLGVSCEPPLATAELDPNSEITPAERQQGGIQRVLVTVGEVPPGRHECEIRIRTDDPEFNLIRVPVRIHGPSTRPSQDVPVFEPLDASDHSE